MADRESRVLLSVVDKYSHGLAGFAGGMENAYSKVKGLQMGLQTLAGGGGGVAGAVIKTVIDATKYTIQWAGEIDQLARSTGAGARETSKLAIVFNDVGIGTNTLERALRKMTAEGLELNFESIKKLAEEYKALPPGMERTKFSFDKFGRAGLEMAEILDRDASELEALGRAAEKSGKIIGDDFVKKAEKMEISARESGAGPGNHGRPGRQYQGRTDCGPELRRSDQPGLCCRSEDGRCQRPITRIEHEPDFQLCTAGRGCDGRCILDQ